MSEHEVTPAEQRFLDRLTRDERSCYLSGMAWWEASVHRPELTERQRVGGALYAALRESTALMVVAQLRGEPLEALTPASPPSPEPVETEP